MSRVMQEIKDQGRFDNTIVIYIAGDNGTSELATVAPYVHLDDRALLDHFAALPDPAVPAVPDDRLEAETNALARELAATAPIAANVASSLSAA